MLEANKHIDIGELDALDTVSVNTGNIGQFWLLMLLVSSTSDRSTDFVMNKPREVDEPMNNESSEAHELSIFKCDGSFNAGSKHCSTLIVYL